MPRDCHLQSSIGAPTRALLVVKMGLEDFFAIEQVTGQPRMQWTRARDMREQILHLIRQNAAPLEVYVLGVGRRERHGDQLQCCLLWRTATLEVIAASACRRNIVPGVRAAVGNWRNVVARQIPGRVTHRTVKTEVAVAFEQSAVVERWYILVAHVGPALACAVCCDNRIHIDMAAPAIERAVSAKDRIQAGSAIIGNLLGIIEPDRLSIVDPLERHSSYIRPQHLLRYVGSNTSEHRFTSLRPLGFCL